MLIDSERDNLGTLGDMLSQGTGILNTEHFRKQIYIYIIDLILSVIIG